LALQKYVRSLLKRSKYDLVGQGITVAEGEAIKADLEIALEVGRDMTTLRPKIHNFRRILDELQERRRFQLERLGVGSIIQHSVPYHQTLFSLDLDSTMPEEQKLLLVDRLNEGEFYEIHNQ
jgi:hypothetical protein